MLNLKHNKKLIIPAIGAILVLGWIGYMAVTDFLRPGPAGCGSSIASQDWRCDFFEE